MEHPTEDQENPLDIEKRQLIHQLEQRQAELLILNTVGQAAAGETDLNKLYRIIHDQIRHIMGEVIFLIALYDPVNNRVEIPYGYESGNFVSVEPFPLGEGLTSILIQTRQPLLLVENTEQQAKKLGAKIQGQAAKSWLGVPLLVGGEVIGAIIVQDTEVEKRFTEADQRLLSTLAPQLAISIRNARFLSEARQQVERQQLLANLAGKIWSSMDVDTILVTALEEIGKAMQVSKGYIVLQPPQG